MSTAAQRRILQDYKKIEKNNDEGIDAVAD